MNREQEQFTDHDNMNRNELKGNEEHETRKYSVGDFDLMAASWVIASLLYGRDDGSAWRDRVEIGIADAMRRAFQAARLRGNTDWPSLPRRTEAEDEASDAIGAEIETSLVLHSAEFADEAGKRSKDASVGSFEAN